MYIHNNVGDRLATSTTSRNLRPTDGKISSRLNFVVQLKTYGFSRDGIFIYNILLVVEKEKKYFWTSTFAKKKNASFSMSTYIMVENHWTLDNYLLSCHLFYTRNKITLCFILFFLAHTCMHQLLVGHSLSNLLIFIFRHFKKWSTNFYGYLG